MRRQNIPREARQPTSLKLHLGRVTGAIWVFADKVRFPRYSLVILSIWEFTTVSHNPHLSLTFANVAVSASLKLLPAPAFCAVHSFDTDLLL